jgi:hypothetical protein
MSRTPAHGNDTCPVSYWTAMSPSSLNLFTHTTTFSNLSRMIISLLPFLYFQRFSMQSRLLSLTAVRTSSSMANLSLWLKSICCLSSSLKVCTAFSHKFSVDLQLSKMHQFYTLRSGDVRKRPSSQKSHSLSHGCALRMDQRNLPGVAGADEYKVIDPARREYHKDVSAKVSGCFSLQLEISPFTSKATNP